MFSPVQTLPAQGFLRLDTCLALCGLGKTKFYSLVRSGEAPAPRKVGRCSLWDAGEFRQFLQHIGSGELAGKGGRP